MYWLCANVYGRYLCKNVGLVIMCECLWTFYVSCFHHYMHCPVWINLKKINVKRLFVAPSGCLGGKGCRAPEPAGVTETEITELGSVSCMLPTRTLSVLTGPALDPHYQSINTDRHSFIVTVSAVREKTNRHNSFPTISFIYKTNIHHLKVIVAVVGWDLTHDRMMSLTVNILSEKKRKRKKKEAKWNGQFDSWAQRLKAQCERLEWIHVPIEPPLCVDTRIQMVVIKVWKHTGYVILFRFYPAIHVTRPDGSLCPCHTGPLKAQTLHIKKKKCRCFITSQSLITGILLGDFWGSNKGEHEALIHNSRQSFKCKRLHEPPAWRETFSIKTFILWNLFPAMAFPARCASLAKVERGARIPG